MPVRISSDASYNFNAATSANGNITAYTRDPSSGAGYGYELWVYNRATGVETKVASADGDTFEDGALGDVAVSADGRFVAFVSDEYETTGTDDDPSQSSNYQDIYFYNTQTGITTRLGANGALADILEELPRLREVAISADGNKVAFVASDFYSFSNRAEVFVYDRQTGEVAPVSGPSFLPATQIEISADGNHVFWRYPGSGAVHAKDLTTGGIFELPVFVASDAEGDVLEGQLYSVSADGRFIAYVTEGANLSQQVALYDRQTQSYEFITEEFAAPHHYARNPSISQDGRFVLFAGNGASESPDSPQRDDIFVYDRQSGEVEMITGTDNGTPPAPGSYAAVFSGDGRTIVVETTAGFDAADGNERSDVYLFDNPFPPTVSNDPPVAEDDAFTLSADGSFILDLLGNDSDPDGGTITITAIQGGAVERGTAVLRNGVVTYTAGDVFGDLGPGEVEYDQFFYEITDAAGATSVAEAVITITGVNDAPVAVADALSVEASGSLANVAGQILANDTDIDKGDTRKLASVDTAGTQGVVSFDAATQQLSYQALGFESLAAGQTGTDSFDYTIVDTAGGTSTATVTVTVTGVNDGPVAAADGFAIDEDAPSVDLTAAILGNDTDVDAGDTKQIVSVDTTGTTGQVVFDAATQQLRYEAKGFDALEAGQTATDTFTYTMRDAAGAISTATVTMTIAGQSDTPVPGTIIGTDGSEGLSGTTGNDIILALGGWDSVQGGNGDDAVDGGSGWDFLSGGNGNDLLFGGEGNDLLTGGNGGDRLFGGAGSDVLHGENGNDVLIGGAGNDFMLGGAGNDRFVMRGQSGDDWIGGFRAGRGAGDVLDLSGTGIDSFAELQGRISSNLFGQAVIDLGEGDSVTLFGVRANQLVADDFAFGLPAPTAEPLALGTDVLFG